MSSEAVADWILTARRQAEIARTIYLGDEFLRLLASSSGANLRTFKANHIQAAALIYDSHVHLVVCGSNDEYDWFANTNSRIREVGYDYPYEAHKGFADSATWLSKEIIGGGFGAFTFGRKVYIGGHSAGGAIAEILPLIDSRFRPESIFTFGAPKWCVNGNYGGSEANSVVQYRAQPWKNYRFVMSYDPVPYLPLTVWRRMLMLRHFAHTSQAIEISDDGSFGVTDTVSVAKRFMAFGGSLMRTTVTGTIATVIATCRQVPAVPAHDAARYYSALESAVRKFHSVEYGE